MDDRSDFLIPSESGRQLFGSAWPVAKPRAVMCLVHGFGEHCGRYSDMAHYLNRFDIAVVAVDLTGHGQTDGKRGVVASYDDFRADLNALLEKSRGLFPDVPHILYGHSMGGGIVMDHGFNPASDIRAIISSAPLIHLAQPVPGVLRVMTKVLRKLLPKGGMSQPIDGSKVSKLPTEQELYENDPLNHGRIGFGLAVDMVETGEAIAEKAGDWTMPLLLLHAVEDELTAFDASQAFATRAQNVRFVPLQNAAHEMHNDATRAQVYELMKSFILEHAG